MSLITVDALFGLFTDHETPTWKRGLLWLAVTLGLVAQFYSGFYLGYFLLLSLGIAAALAILWPSTRHAFLVTLRHDAPLIAATAVVSGLLLRPMVVHYLVASRTVGERNFFIHVSSLVPSWKSLFYLGPDSWLWGWPIRLGFYPSVYEWTEKEKRLGIGLVTMVACTAGLYWNRDRRSIRLIAVVSFILLLSGISVPRIAALGISVAASYLALAGLYHIRREHPWMRLLVPGLIFALLQADLFGSWAGVGIGLFALLLVVLDLYQSGDEPRLRLVLVVLALGLGLSLFSPGVMVIGAGVGGLAAGVAAIFGLRPYGRIGLVALVGLLLFACIATYLRRPEALIAAGSAPLFVALTKPARFRLSADTLFATLLFALLAVVAYRATDTGWYILYLFAPGASAVRALGRVVLMSLIAWAIGLGLFVKEMQERRRPIGAMLITLVCLLEQGLTTPFYDKQEHRIAVDAIARRIDRRDAVLYWSPHRAPMPTPDGELYMSRIENLNAMWAALERGVPTINGYSGNFPPGWSPLFQSSIHNEYDSLCLETSLRHWAGERGLSLERIDWVGGPEGWPRGDATASPSPDISIPPGVPLRFPVAGGQNQSLRACVRRHLCRLQTSKHQANHGDMNHRLTGRRQPLVVLAQPPAVAQPGERPLHDPPPGQLKAQRSCPIGSRRTSQDH